jgi:hypothetical protein
MDATEVLAAILRGAQERAPQDDVNGEAGIPCRGIALRDFASGALAKPALKGEKTGANKKRQRRTI